MIIGILIPVYTYPNRINYPGYKLIASISSYNDNYYYYANVYYSLILALLIGISIIGLVSIINLTTKKIKLFSKNRVLFATLVFFFFFPMFGSWADFYPISVYITYFISTTLSTAAYSTLEDPLFEYSLDILPGFYFLIIGFVLLLLSLLLTTLIVSWTWSERKRGSDVNRYSNTSNGIAGFIFEISLIIIGILAGIGVVLGISLPNYNWVYRATPGDERITSLLIPERSFYTGTGYNYKKYLNFNALFYLILISFIVIGFLIYFLSKLRIIKKPATIAPALFFLTVTLLIPSPSVYGIGSFGRPAGVVILLILSNLFYNAAYDLVRYNDAVIDTKMVVGFFGWILFISIILLYVVFILVAAKSFVAKRKMREGLVKEKIKEEY